MQAIIGVNVLDVRSGRIQADQSVLFDERIHTVGPTSSVAIPETAAIIGATGWTVTPGLIDCHAHLEASTLSTYLGTGVLTVRDVGNDAATVRAMRDGEATGSITGPRVRMCGPYVQMEPVAPWAQPSIVVRDPSAVPEVIDELLGYDVDAVKLYVSVNAQVTETLVAKAHEAGLPVTAHLGAVRATEAAGFGIDGIEHAAQGLYADLVSPRLRLEADDRFKLGLSNFWARFMAGWAEVDPESQRSVDAIAAVTRAGTSLTPTLSVLAQTLAVAGSGPPTGHGRTSLEIWTDDLRRLSGDWTTDQIAQAHEGFQRILAAVLCFSKVGGRIVVGTDLPPGESYAEELALLSRAGLSPAAVIRAATQDAADVIGLGSDTGSIDAGKTADLVLVKGNPLNDMGSFANVIVAIKRGQIVLSRSDQ